MNWRRHRSHVHNRAVLDNLCRDMKKQQPDHIALTGDLVNLGLPDEFVQAKTWLEELGNSDWISLTPGNHDSYVRLPTSKGMQKWSDYMQSDKKGATLLKNSAQHFPYIRFLKPEIAVIGLSSSLPTLPFMATGTLGNSQISALNEVIKEVNRQSAFCIILIHHPPLSNLASSRRGLTDADQLQPVLEKIENGIVLHGHNHQNSVFNLKTEKGILPIVGVPSASCGKTGKEPLARYNLLEIEKIDGNWNCLLTGRGYKTSLNDGIMDIETFRLF